MLPSETTAMFSIGITKHLHEKLSSWAREDRTSLNALVLESLRKAVEARRSEGMADYSPPGCARPIVAPCSTRR